MFHAFFSDNSVCNGHFNEESCLSVKTSPIMITSDSTCTWTILLRQMMNLSQTCDLRPPPKDIRFVLLLSAAVTLLITKPITALFGIFIRRILSQTTKTDNVWFEYRLLVRSGLFLDENERKRSENGNGNKNENGMMQDKLKLLQIHNSIKVNYLS
jgi:hypothetical protein